MNNVKAVVARFVKDEEGLTTVEYAVAGALIAAAVVAAFKTLGETVQGKITDIDTAIQNGG